MKTVRKKRFIGACLFGMAFLSLMLIMYAAPHTFLFADTYITAIVRPFQTLAIVEWFIAITTLANATGIVGIACIVAYYLRAKRIEIVRLILLLAASSISMEIVKLLIGRVRPPALPWLGALHSSSFPSGHATLSMALFGFIAVIVYTRAHTPISKAIAVIIPGAVIILIAASRIILAAHYFSDIVGGLFLGGFWLFLVFSLPLTRIARTWRL